MVVPVQRNSYQREEGLYQREERINIGQREERINEDRIMQEIFLLKKEMSRVSVELLVSFFFYFVYLFSFNIFILEVLDWKYQYKK